MLYPQIRSSRANARRITSRAQGRSTRLLVELLEDRTLLSAMVCTDQQDYPPGATAVISGAGFVIGETVDLLVVHTDGTPNTGGGHEVWQVTDGGAGDLDGQLNGAFQTTWYVNPDDSAGSAFLLTAAGDQGSNASHTFTDSVALDYSPTDTTLTATGSTVSFTQTVTAQTRPNPQTQTFTASIKTSGLPEGVTVTTSPAALSFGPVYPSTPSWVVTFNIAPSVPNGTYSAIRIKASPDAQSVSEGSGTQVTLIVARSPSLVVLGTNGPDTIIINGTTLSNNGVISSIAGVENLTIDTLGANDTISVNNATFVGNLVLTGGPDVDAISLNGVAAASVSVTGENVTTSGAVQAGAGGITVSASSLAANGAITTTAGGAVTLAATGSASFTAAADISSDGPVVLTGAGGISTAGDITTTNDLIAFASPTVLSGPVAINAGTGAVTIQSTLDGPGGLTVTASGDTTFNGSVGGTTPLASLTSNGGGATLINGGLVRTTGTQTYADAVTLGASTALTTTGDGNIAFASSVTASNANTITVTAAGAITMPASAATSSGAGAITFQAGGGIVLGVISTAGNVSLTAGGAIADANGPAMNVTASNLAMTAGAGIGTASDPIETTVSGLAAHGGSGGVYVSNTGPLIITSASSAGGDVSISSDATITLPAGASVTTDAGAVTLAATVIVVAPTADVESSGDVTLNAVDEVVMDGQVQAGGNVALTGGAVNANFAGASMGSVAFNSQPTNGRQSRLNLASASFAQASFSGTAFDIDATGATFNFAQFDADALGFDPDALGFAASALGFALNATGFDPDAQGFDIDALGFALVAAGFDFDALGFDPDAFGFDIDASGATFGSVLFLGNAFDIDASGATFDFVQFDTDASGFDFDAMGFDPDAVGFDPDALGFAYDALGFDVDASGATFGTVLFTGNAFDIDANGATFELALFDADADGFDPDALGFDPDALGFDLDSMGFDVDAIGATFGAVQFQGQYFEINLTDSDFGAGNFVGSNFDVNLFATTFGQMQTTGSNFNVDLSSANFGQGFFLSGGSSFTAFSATFDQWFNFAPGVSTSIDVSGSTFTALTNDADDVTQIIADGATFGRLENRGDHVSNISALGADFEVIANYGDFVTGVAVSGSDASNTLINYGDDASGIDFAGGAGRDLFVNTGNRVTASFQGGDGDDLAHLAGTDVTATLDGGAGSDAVVFAGALTGSITLNDAPESVADAGQDALDFSAFSAAIGIDLASTIPQTVGAGLLLTLTNDVGIENVVGTAFADVIRGNARGNYLAGADLIDDRAGAPSAANGRVQVVFLDFTSETSPSERPYETEEREAIKAGMEALYRGPDGSQPWFAVEFYLSASAAAARAAETGNGDYATIFFNKPRIEEDGSESPGGVSDEVDFRNLSLGGTAAVQVHGLLGGEGQAADEPPNWIAASVYIGAHELAHMLGVRHADAYGPIGYGIHNPPGAGAYDPAYPGLAGAFETNYHLISSTGATGTALTDIVNPHFFGEREAIRLAFAFYAPTTPQAGTLFVPETAGSHGDLESAQLLVLQTLNVPNTLASGSYNAGKQFAVAAVDVLGSMTADDEADVYSFTGRKGDLINLEVVSDGVIRPGSATDATRNSDNRAINSVVEIFDGTGTLIAYFDSESSTNDQFEAFDSTFIDLVLPVDGTYSIRVTTHAAEDELGAFTPENPGLYELYLYRFDTGNASDQADTLEGRGGNDTLEGGIGGDRYVFAGSVLGSDVIREDVRFEAQGGQVGARDSADTLDFANLTTGVAIDLARTDVQVASAGNLSLQFSSADAIEVVLGTALGDTLLGNARNNLLWGGVGGTDRLEGRAGDDFFIFDATAAGAASVLGGDGLDTLDFSGQADAPTTNFLTRTAGVTIDLSRIGNAQSAGAGLTVALLAMDVESTYGSLVGDNTLTGNPLDNILVGGAGSDQLSGQSGNDILVGGDGDDILVGSDGRDILIGGFGADNVTGSNGEDILVGGRTAYDYSPALSYIGADGLTHAYRGDFTYEALRAIRAEWSSSRDYATRIANLSNRPGQTSNRVNGAFFLIGGLDTSADGTVASNDGATDKLTGSNDKDWFFTESTRDITDLKANEKTEI